MRYLKCCINLLALSHGYITCGMMLIFMACSSFARGNPDYIVRHFTNEDGLPQNSVVNVKLDNNGFLWMVTQGGISRYDGSNFKLYNSANTCLPTDRISWLIADKNGTIYLRPSLNTPFYKFTAGCELVYDTLLNSKPYVYFGKMGEPVIIDTGVCRNDLPGRKQLMSRLTVMTSPYNMSVNEHQLYYLYHNQLEFFDNRSGLVTTCPLKVNSLSFAMAVNDLLLVPDASGKWQAIRHGKPLNRIPATPGFLQLIERITTEDSNSARFYRNSNTSTLLCTGGNVWQIKMDHGLLDATLLFTGIDFPQIMCLLYDEPSKTLFAGTVVNGLYTVTKRLFNTISFDPRGPESNNVYAQIQCSEKMVLNRYCRYHPPTATYERLNPSLPQTAFFKTADGRLWYSTGTHIVGCDTTLTRCTRIPFPDQQTGENIIGCFTEDEERKLWFSLDHSVGYVQGDSLPVFSIYKSAYFYKYKISVLFPFSKDILWIGHANGIVALDKRTNRMDSVQLAGHDVRTIYRARDQSLWIGTYGKGFYKYHNGRFVKMPLDKHRYLLFNHSFNEDRQGFFWIPTNNGLFQCKKEELDAYAAAPGKLDVYYFYYRNCGKYTNEFNGGSNPMSVFYKQLLLLPTINGVVSFAPDSMMSYLPNRNIMVEHVKVDDQEVDWQNGFLLSPAFKRIELSVAAPYMGDPVNNILEYNLNEGDAEWYPVYNDGKIIYNKLSPGSYQLNIRKRTGFGIDNYAYRRIRFTVAPFWYQTYWFVFLAISFLAVLLYCLVKWRIALLERSKRVLENTVMARTAELHQTVNELHKSEQHLSSVNQIQEKAIAIILHDIQSPLNYLSTYARYFNLNINKLSPNEVGEFTGSLAESASEINKFTNDLLQWLIFNQDDRTVQNERIDLPALLQEVGELYTSIVQFSSNMIDIIPGGPEYIFTDRNKVKLVIRNLVDNANKNSVHGKIVISSRVDESGDFALVSIADTGRGMNDAEVKELLQRTQENNTSLRTGKLGFALVLDCLELIGGRVEIQSQSGKGTTMLVYLPIQSHNGEHNEPGVNR